MWQQCETILEADGDLAEKLPGYQPRLQQLEMAEAVCKAISKKENLVVEAGTGIGKTFAYLIPALLSRSKTIIATGTKNLQDQLFFRDLPFIQSLLKIPVKTSLLKGRSNYLCRHRIEQSTTYDDMSRHLEKSVAEITQQLPGLERGEIGEVEGVAEDSPIWPYVTSTIDNCLNQDCAYYDTCYLIKARREAQSADVIVVNHHLFFADAVIKQEDQGELLPKAETIIFDEAHQIPDIASQFYGKQFSSRQIHLFFNDLRLEWSTAAADQIQLPDVLLRIEQLIQKLQNELGASGIKKPWHTLKTNLTVIEAKDTLLDEFVFLISLLEQLSERSKGLQQCYTRGQRLQQLLIELTEFEKKNAVHWYEIYGRGFTIRFTPLNVAEECQQLYDDYAKTWIFTSATLAIGNTLKHFAISIGADDAKQLCLSSPFDYQQQALLYMPRYLSDPKTKQYCADVVKIAIPIIEALKGRTMMLFTSYTALHDVRDLLQQQLKMDLLVQGDMPKDQLVKQFISTKSSVLLATQSFWEGVDIKGADLSCVIIDKLPFMRPDNPVLQARVEEIRAKGEDPFAALQLPNAAMSLKQGAGRLIRDIKDSGILVICDPRLISRQYGPWLLANLPPMRRTRDLMTVLTMIETINT